MKLVLVFCLSVLLHGLPALATDTDAGNVKRNAAESSLIETGRKIYTQGILGSGVPLRGTRGAGLVLQGKEAACISCHRSSGMGSVEGNLRVPPISKRFMFPEPGDLVMANTDGIRGKTLNQTHAPYTEESFARVLRDGLGVTGAQLQEVMPRYNLSDADRAALKAYLMQLSADYAPGVSKETIQFAVVIAPGTSPERKKVFMEMVQAVQHLKNGSTSPRKRYMTSAATFASQTERRWDVQIWELSGAPETWRSQLEERYQRNPVFALLSGLSDSTWAPINDFCKAQRVPCWFPSVPLASGSAGSYGLYFSRGVQLEAEALAMHLASAMPKAGRVLQVAAKEGIGDIAATSLQQALKASSQDASLYVLQNNNPNSITDALQTARPGDTLVLWLGMEQIKLLNALAPPAGVQIYMSSSMSFQQGRTSLPAQWKAAVRFVYPYELPSKRQANLAYLHAWLKLQNIALVDEELQSEVFFSLTLMTETLQDMLDNLYRDYLIERTEDMLGKRESGKAEQENRDRRMLGRTARLAVAAEAAKGGTVAQAPTAQMAQRRAFAVGESEGTTVYPRLSLGPAQHFASKGAYIVRYASDGSDQLLLDSDWIVP